MVVSGKVTGVKGGGAPPPVLKATGQVRTIELWNLSLGFSSSSLTETRKSSKNDKRLEKHCVFSNELIH